jgi:NADPH:quinone reductase-like Zn-dependent oxidoreductase
MSFLVEVIPNPTREIRFFCSLCALVFRCIQSVNPAKHFFVPRCESDVMRTLMLYGDRDLRLMDMEPPQAPQAGEVQIHVRALALNYLDVWGFRGMAFAKRKMPQVAGVEASGEVVAVGTSVTTLNIGDKVVMYGAQTCGTCKACREGRDNLCEYVGGIMGFHLDGFAQEFINRPERLVVKVPDEVSFEDAACAPIGFGTVQHMLFDNAKLQPEESILIHAGGSGIGTAAIKMAKAIGCTVYTTVGDDEKGEKAKSLGADYVVNYRTERFEGEIRQLTKRKGVDVVFEHVGAETWNGSLLCLKRGGRLVTCGSTSGVSVQMNLMQLFQQQYRIFGSFGCSMRNIRESLEKMAKGMKPVIDSTFELADFALGLERLEGRKVFGKVVIRF